MSKIKVNRLENTSTANGGIDIDTDGHVQFDGLQMPTAGALSNRNLIMNGAMQVAQRGTSNSGQNSYAVDRFNLQSSSTDTTISQEDVASGTDPYNLGFRRHVRITNTSTTGASNGYRILRHRIEAQNIACSGWQYTSTTSYITLSFWVKASVSQEYYGLIRTENSPRQVYAFSLGTIGTTWTKVTKTIPGAASNVISNDNNAGLNVDLYPWLAGDFTNNNPLETWAAEDSSNYLPDMSNTWASTAGATFDITGVLLEVGSKATTFEHRSYGDELAKCMRYIQIIDGTNAGGALTIGNGCTRSANNTHMQIPLGIALRDKPALSITNTVRIIHGGNSQTSSADSLTINGVTPSVHTDDTNFNVTLNYNGNVSYTIGANQGGVAMMLNTPGTVRLDSEL